MQSNQPYPRRFRRPVRRGAVQMKQFFPTIYNIVHVTETFVLFDLGRNKGMLSGFYQRSTFLNQPKPTWMLAKTQFSRPRPGSKTQTVPLKNCNVKGNVHFSHLCIYTKVIDRFGSRFENKYKKFGADSSKYCFFS